MHLDIEKADSDSQLQGEFIGKTMDLGESALLRRKSVRAFWRNGNNVAKWPQLCAMAESFLLAFPRSCLAIQMQF